MIFASENHVTCNCSLKRILLSAWTSPRKSKSKNCFVVLFTSNSNNVQLVHAEDRSISVGSKMFPEIQLDSKRRQEFVALMCLRLRLLKLRRLKLEAALTIKNGVGDSLNDRSTAKGRPGENWETTRRNVKPNENKKAQQIFGALFLVAYRESTTRK